MIKPVEERAGVTRIVRAAIRKGHAVFSVPRPGRHHHALALMSDDALSPHDGTQGFLTNDGAFVDRVEAAIIAREAGQIQDERKTGNPAVLYSEDLW